MVFKIYYEAYLKKNSANDNQLKYFAFYCFILKVNKIKTLLGHSHCNSHFANAKWDIP